MLDEFVGDVEVEEDIGAAAGTVVVEPAETFEFAVFLADEQWRIHIAGGRDAHDDVADFAVFEEDAQVATLSAVDADDCLVILGIVDGLAVAIDVDAV